MISLIKNFKILQMFLKIFPLFLPILVHSLQKSQRIVTRGDLLTINLDETICDNCIFTIDEKYLKNENFDLEYQQGVVVINTSMQVWTLP